jgi:hypothetical protein
MQKAAELFFKDKSLQIVGLPGFAPQIMGCRALKVARYEPDPQQVGPSLKGTGNSGVLQV